MVLVLEDLLVVGAVFIVLDLDETVFLVEIGLANIMVPAAVWLTRINSTSISSPILLLARSTTTMVPSLR